MVDLRREEVRNAFVCADIEKLTSISKQVTESGKVKDIVEKALKPYDYNVINALFFSGNAEAIERGAAIAKEVGVNMKKALENDDYYAIGMLFRSGNAEAIERGVAIAKEAGVDMKKALENNGYQAVRWLFGSGNAEAIEKGIAIAKEAGVDMQEGMEAHRCDVLRELFESENAKEVLDNNGKEIYSTLGKAGRKYLLDNAKYEIPPKILSKMVKNWEKDLADRPVIGKHTRRIERQDLQKKTAR